MINRVRRIAFAVFLFLPLIYMQFGRLNENVSNLREVQQSFYQYFAMCITACFIGNVWLGCFLVLNVLLYIYNGQEVGSMQVLNILFGCLLFLFSRNFFKNNKLSDFYKYILFIVSINLVWQFLQLVRLDPVFAAQTNAGVVVPGAFNDPVGFFGIKMAMGTFYTLVLPIIASINIFIAPLLFIPIFLSKSSSVFLAAMVVTLFYTFYLHRKLFLILLVLFPIASMAYIGLDLKTDSRTFTSRFPVWHSAISYTLKNEHGFLGLIGYGPDSYRNFTKHKNFKFVGDNFYNHGVMAQITPNEIGFKYYSPTNDVAKIEMLNKNISKTKISQGIFDEWDNPHCEIVQMFFQYGWIGIFLLIGLLREIYLRFKYTIKDKELIVLTSCLLVYFVTSLTHFPLELARTGYLFPLILGAYYSKTDL